MSRQPQDELPTLLELPELSDEFFELALLTPPSNPAGLVESVSSKASPNPTALNQATPQTSLPLPKEVLQGLSSLEGKKPDFILSAFVSSAQNPKEAQFNSVWEPLLSSAAGNEHFTRLTQGFSAKQAFSLLMASHSKAGKGRDRLAWTLFVDHPADFARLTKAYTEDQFFDLFFLDSNGKKTIGDYGIENYFFTHHLLSDVERALKMCGYRNMRGLFNAYRPDIAYHPYRDNRRQKRAVGYFCFLALGDQIKAHLGLSEEQRAEVPSRKISPEIKKNINYLLLDLYNLYVSLEKYDLYSVCILYLQELMLLASGNKSAEEIVSGFLLHELKDPTFTELYISYPALSPLRLFSFYYTCLKGLQRKVYTGEFEGPGPEYAKSITKLHADELKATIAARPAEGDYGRLFSASTNSLGKRLPVEASEQRAAGESDGKKQYRSPPGL